ncbi:hypothetical protein [Flintibacter muris]|uniref:hypothetical protein n=1 Tax=Flintibacter muris TaxID=2941327 RepID=UPI00203C3845|nr:hypothetical protein [Flintibacter muris]
MSSESDRQLSMEELRRRNTQRPATETQHPTAEEWLELTAALTTLGELLAEQMLLLEQIAAQPKSWETQEQTAELIREAKVIRSLLEQAGRKREQRFSLPTIRLPRLSVEWLLLPTVLVGLLALWYGWAALWNGLTTLFP